MRVSSSRSARVSPLLLTLALFGAGIGIGRWLVSDLEPGPASDRTAARDVGVPSLAPIVDGVRDGVVGVRAFGPDVLKGSDGEVVELVTADGIVSGSGFVIHERGLVVTNHHLVAGADEVLVDLPGSRTRGAVLVGADAVTDIAVLRVEGSSGDLVALRLGDSTALRQGDWVVTVGNPFHYHHTVTAGVVSYVGRHIPEEGLLVSNEYLQFSAPVNPGSSGGPVLDLRGEVVGVITSTHGRGTGISFAVPSKVLRWVLEAMEEHGEVERGWLGIRLQPLDPGLQERLGLAGGGALVRRVEPGTPAHRAGLQAGDVVAAWNGATVPDAYTLFDWITYAKPGARATIEVLRGDARLPPLEVELGAVAWRQPPPGPGSEPSH